MANEKLSRRVADAIELIHQVRFSAGRAPGAGDSHLLHEAYAIATVARSAHLRIFQKAGVSSTVVADAVRLGILHAAMVKP